MGERLIMFTGAECKHCKKMDPLVQQLEKENNIQVTRMEVWHNAENANFLESVDKNSDGSPFCRGVPFFYNEKTSKKLCGNQSYEKLKAWAQGSEESAQPKAA